MPSRSVQMPGVRAWQISSLANARGEIGKNKMEAERRSIYLWLKVSRVSPEKVTVLKPNFEKYRGLDKGHSKCRGQDVRSHRGVTWSLIMASAVEWLVGLRQVLMWGLTFIIKALEGHWILSRGMIGAGFHFGKKLFGSRMDKRLDIGSYRQRHQIEDC